LIGLFSTGCRFAVGPTGGGLSPLVGPNQAHHFGYKNANDKKNDKPDPMKTGHAVIEDDAKKN